MYDNIIITLINMIYYAYKDKKTSDNEYTKERKNFYKEKIFIILISIGIANIIVNCLTLIIMLLSNISINVIYIITSITALLSTILLISSKRRNKRSKIIEKKLINEQDISIIISNIIFVLASKTIFKNTIDYLFITICLILIITNLIIIIKKIIKEKENVSYNSNNEDYFEDIKFTRKIVLNKAINYVSAIFAFIVFALIQIPYIFILYILVVILMMYIIYKKIKKMENQGNLLYRKITIANEMPGVVYAFQFNRDITLLKRLVIILVFYILSIISLYIVGESAFIIITIGFFIHLLYKIIEDKLYLIKCIKSYNDTLIDKKKYTIDLTRKISYIDRIKIFNINLYKIIIKDNIIYESNIILYDPEIQIKEMNIKINKANIDDYIIIEEYLYDEE